MISQDTYFSDICQVAGKMYACYSKTADSIFNLTNLECLSLYKVQERLLVSWQTSHFMRFPGCTSKPSEQPH